MCAAASSHFPAPSFLCVPLLSLCSLFPPLLCVLLLPPQRLETQRANLPDSFTYTVLVRAMLVSGRCELAQQVRVTFIALLALLLLLLIAPYAANALLLEPPHA